ncbi:MAG: sigma-54 dependent transcriptional regulator [bacterium]|nr:sigma-54 dependent transcriptional regulator [bacterium]
MSATATRQVLRQLVTRFGIVGESPLMVQTITRLLQVAPTDLTVLLTGETGTGKEVFAHAVHELSERKRFPFVSVNCGAIPETLLESELFGAQKGAYTGSVEQRKGFFETANKGTIFLDEIGDMPIGTQVKLLRVLESGEFTRLGSSEMQKVDVRIITATNRDLIYEVRQGRFRQDLYFRLNSVNIHLPPLRQHADDVPLLVEHFATKVVERSSIVFDGIDADATELLAKYPWPGNVRELRNIVETMVTLERGARITLEMAQRYLPDVEARDLEPSTAIVRVADIPKASAEADIGMMYRTLLQLSADVMDVKNVLRHLLAMSVQQPGAVSPTAVVPHDSYTPVSIREPHQPVVREPHQPLVVRESYHAGNLPTLNVADLERQAIVEALRGSQGNRREAAVLLGMSERTLYRKIDEYGLA